MPWVPVDDDPSGRVTRWVEGPARSTGAAGGAEPIAPPAQIQRRWDGKRWEAQTSERTVSAAEKQPTRSKGQDPLDDIDRELEHARLRRQRTPRR